MKKSSGFLNRNYYMRFVVALLVYGAVYTAGGYILTQNLIVSVAVSAVFAPLSAFSYRKKYIEKQKLLAEEQFVCFMQLVLTSVCAGKPIEQAFYDAVEEAEREKGKPFGVILNGLRTVEKRAAMNFGFYDEFIDFAVQTGSGNVISLAYAVKIVGIKGGNMAFVLRSSLAGLRVKLETDNEIKKTLALPVYNHKIITVMPFALVLMIKSLSKEYIDVLYNTKEGLTVVVSVCVAMFLARMLGDRLCRIKV